MGFLDRFFKPKKAEPIIEKAPEKTTVSAPEPKETWIEVPNFIESHSENDKLVGIIASSIAAGDNADSKFKVKRILKENPEAQLVSVIATSIAAIEQPDSHFIIRKISKKIEDK